MVEEISMKTTMNDTPETDSLAGKIDPSTLEHDAYATMTIHALRMERQRDEARREAERWRDCLKYGMSMQPKAPSNVFPWENDEASHEL